MSQNYDRIILKCLIDTLIFLEFSDENSLNEDSAMELLEQITCELQSMDIENKERILDLLKHLTNEYPESKRDFIRCLPETLGLI